MPTNGTPNGRTTSRRTLVTAGAAAIGGLATILVSGTATEGHVSAPPVHGDSDTLEPAVSGNNNDAGPGVFGSSVGGAGVLGRHDGAALGPAVAGINNGTGPGVVGENTGSGPGVLGIGTTGAGVRGESSSAVGVRGVSDTAPGVFGQHTSPTVGAAAVVGENSGLGPGVLGRAVGHNSGVRGEATVGVGVIGVRTSATEIGPAIVALNSGAGAGLQGIAPGGHPAVIAQTGSVPPGGGPFTADCGVALAAVGKTILRLPTESDGLPIGTACSGPTLHVDGPAVIAGPLFMRVGNGTIAAGARDMLVAANVSTSSHVSVTLVGDPGRGGGDSAVSWVERMSGAFRVHLTRKVDQDTPFTFTVVGPS